MDMTVAVINMSTLTTYLCRRTWRHRHLCDRIDQSLCLEEAAARILTMSTSASVGTDIGNGKWDLASDANTSDKTSTYIGGFIGFPMVPLEVFWLLFLILGFFIFWVCEDMFEMLSLTTSGQVILVLFI